MENSVDPDKTGLVYTVCPEFSVPKIRIIGVLDQIKLVF